MTIDERTQRGVYQPRFELRNRYIFKGQLVMKTALHIGGGRATLSSSDSPVVLTPDQKPFIPGSSLKGSLRSTIEKIVPGLPGFSSCALIERSNEELKGLDRNAIRKICPTARQSEVAQRRRDQPQSAKNILQETLEDLCDTCRLFGSPFAAGHMNVSDLYMPEGAWSDIIQIRDGVAIDRDSEKARDRLKYDFEVVPVSTAFDLEIVLENATKKDLQLLCVGLSEFVHEFGVIGGKRSRGLGVAKLDGLKVSALELDTEGVNETKVDDAERRKRLQQYLVKKQFSSPDIAGTEFLEAYINSIFV